MKRMFFMVLGLVVMAGLAAFAQGGVAVPPNTVPPPGLPPSSWACYPTCVFPADIVAADFNQDGWLDLAVSCSETGNVDYYQSWGYPRGIFTLPPVAIGGLPNARDLVAGHIGGYDGFPDLAIVNSMNWTDRLNIVSLVGGTPAGLPAVVPAVLPGTVKPIAPLVLGNSAGEIIDIAGGNFTNNNVLDLAYLTGGGLTVLGWANPYTSISGLGPLALNGETPVALVAADFDQNGWDDIAVVTATPSLFIFFNAPVAAPPHGNFVPVSRHGPIPITIPIPTAIDAGDFDADGFPDIVVVGNRSSDGILRGMAEVIINNVHQQAPTLGAGTFLPLPLGAMLTWGFDARDVEVLDADGNGRDDFAVANWGSATVSVFLSDARGLIPDTRSTVGPIAPCLNPGGMNPDRLSVSFQQFKIELQCGYFPIALAGGDFDRNGKMDLAVALQSSDDELCAQNTSCIEIDFDIACRFVVGATPSVPGQIPHSKLLVGSVPESPDCTECKDGPCAENSPPSTGIQTEGDSKNP